jgi:hypothetical protein
VPCSASRVVPGAHRVVGPGTHRGSGPREVHTTAPKLLWRPVAAVAPTASPFVSEAAPPSAASLWVITAFESLGVAGDACSRDWKLGGRRRWQARKPPPSMGQVGGGRDEVKLVYSMLTARFHVRCPSCGPCSSRGPGRSTLRGVRSWMKGDAEGCARRVQCARRTLDSVSGFI